MFHCLDSPSNSEDAYADYGSGLIDFVKFLAFGSLDLQEVWVGRIKGLGLETYLFHLSLSFKGYIYQ